jgi:xanthine dehydrogenase YagS FAD-binding subunit
MKTFSYQEATTASGATTAVHHEPGAMFFAGGTTLVDLLKLDVLTPRTLVGVGRLAFADIALNGDGSVLIGANVTNSQLAWHPAIRDRYPVLSEAILAGATTQLRNMATVAGNIMQRTRCAYFRDVHAACNRRQPRGGCDAMDGFNRGHAVLGISEQCIATHPSDMCVAMVILDAVVQTVKADGMTRAIPFVDVHRVPGDTPEIETVLEHGELITHVLLPAAPMARRSHYLKVRDRASYEFALAAAAVALELDGVGAGDTIRTARIGLGGVATKPWRCVEAERMLVGRRATEESFREAADAALAGAVGRQHNQFKIELAKRTLVRALGTAREMTL